MKMIVTIHQPNYLPYLGFFEKASNAEILILYDNTQFKTDDFQNRNKIRIKDGWMWLTVPVEHNFGDMIKDIKINNKIRWARKHWMSITANYSKAPYFKKYKNYFEEIYSKEWRLLSELNIEIIKTVFKLLNIKTKVKVASELLELKTKSTQALVDMCKAVGATEYISGADGEKYIEKGLFDKANIKVRFQHYSHPEYNQAYPGFEPYMCILDLLFNHGGDSLKILRNEDER